jgi:isopenicillin N synthase-like dioxygenase
MSAQKEAQGKPMTMTSIPTIDLSPYLAGSTDGRRAVAREVNRACEEIGFFLIKGHGVPQEMIDCTYSKAAEFFHLPVEDKLPIRTPSPEIARGYTPFKGETLSAGLGNKAPADLKEMIDMGPVDVPGGAYYEQGDARNFFYPNLWPAKPAEFEPVMVSYYRRMNRLANDLMGVFALALDLPEDFFFDKLDKNMSALRIICYPEQKTPPEPGQLRGGAHTDYGTLTILMSDKAAGGLQAQHRDGHWVDVTTEPGAYVVNIGDIMQIWTNDRWVSTLHRVVNPPAKLADTSRRHSVVFFHQPNYDALIDTLPSCYSQKRPKKYEALTYKDHWLGKWNATRK